MTLANSLLVNISHLAISSLLLSAVHPIVAEVLDHVQISLRFPISNGKAIVIPLAPLITDIRVVELFAHDLRSQLITFKVINCFPERSWKPTNAHFCQLDLAIA